MNTIQIDKSAAEKLYAEANTAGKNLLKALCGDEYFLVSIMDRVKSYEDACNVLDLKTFAPTGSPDEVAYIKLKTIIAALNEDWTPDWNDSDEYKYYPWWNMKGEFSLVYVAYHYQRTIVGSRLCFKNEELAQYAADHFIDLYKQFYTISK